MIDREMSLSVLRIETKSKSEKDKSNFLIFILNRLGYIPTMAHMKATSSLTTLGIWLGYIQKWLGSKNI
jgi:hypothetical protein